MGSEMCIRDRRSSKTTLLVATGGALPILNYPCSQKPSPQVKQLLGVVNIQCKGSRLLVLGLADVVCTTANTLSSAMRSCIVGVFH